MKNGLLGFEAFNRIVEAAETGKGGDSSFFLAYSNEAEKKAQERFVTEVSMMDPKALNAQLDEVLAGGRRALSGLDQAFSIREQRGLDKGELRKEGEWYIGKGAWRVNAAKANVMGMAPAYMDYFDPMQAEILEKYWNETHGKSGASVSADGELNIDFSDVMGDEEEETVPANREREFAMAESRRYKYLKVFENDDFTLGPPSKAAQSEGVVVDTKRLVKALVNNFFLETRTNIMIWGAPGIGKTEVVKGAAAEISKQLGRDKPLPVMVVTLATKEAVDLSGLPLLYAKNAMSDTIIGSEDRGKVGMDYAYPGWLPGPGDDEEGILFFDEINRADQAVLGAALTLLLDRTSGKYKMPDGWRVWAAGNRDVDGPIDPLEGAVASRFLGGHYHLVPTVEDWSEWARSEGAYFKSISGDKIEEWYIPDELLSFFLLKDVKEAGKAGDGGQIYSRGRSYRVKFEYFYNWNKAASEESGGGQMTGFPTPRTWSEAMKTLFQMVRRSPFIKQVAENVDPRKKTISVLGLALNDREFGEELADQLAAIVGNNAADAFVEYTALLARHNDAQSTLVEKVENVFSNPKGPRPLLSVEGRVSADETFALLQSVEGAFDSKVADKSLNTKNFIYWQKWCMELEDSKKASESDITPHITSIFNKHGLYIKPLASASNPDMTPDLVAIIKEFAARYREQIQKLGAL
jgi:MoxR-like ATPase